MLAGAQARDGALVVGAAGQVVAAQALDRDDRAAAQQRRGGRDRVARVGARARRSARRAARTPGRRSAGRGSGGRAGPRTRRRQAAHIAKPAMVVQRPVVGHAADDREARPAVGAVDERVAVAAVGRVDAARAGSRRRSRCRARRAPRGAPPASLLARSRSRGSPVGRRRRSDGRRRSTRASGGASAAQPREERVDRRRLALDLDHDAARRRCSTYPARPSSRGQAVHERPEADALHDALDAHRDRVAAAARPPRSPGSSANSRAARAGGRLRLLDARDVLRRRDDHVVGQALGGDPPAVVADQRDRRAGRAGGPRASAAMHVAPSRRWSTARAATSPGRRRR